MRRGVGQSRRMGSRRRRPIVVGLNVVVIGAVAGGLVALIVAAPIAAWPTLGVIVVLGLVGGSVVAHRRRRSWAREAPSTERVAAERRAAGGAPALGRAPAPPMVPSGALDDVARDLQARKDELDQTRAAFREVLARLGEVLASTHDFDGIVAAIVKTSLLVVPADVSIYYRLVGEPAVLEAVQGSGVPVTGLRLDGTGLAGSAAAHGCLVTIAPGLAAPKLVAVGDGLVLAPSALEPAEPIATAGVAVPLYSLGRLTGVLALYGTGTGRPFTDDQIGLLRSLVHQVEAAIANIELHEKARLEARTDGLTGLWNRRHFDLRLRDAVSTYRRFGESFSVALFDLDDFKRINDTWDHLTGDDALVHFAVLLRKVTREVDVVSRWGGEEFAVLLQRTAPADASAVAQRVVDLVRETPMAHGDDHIGFTVSAGVASHPWDGADGDAVLAVADAALLQAKAAGKDRIGHAAAGAGSGAGGATPAGSLPTGSLPTGSEAGGATPTGSSSTGSGAGGATPAGPPVDVREPDVSNARV